MNKIQEQKTTGGLIETLKKVKTMQDKEAFIRENTVNGYRDFADYYNDHMIRNQLDTVELIKKSNISSNYFYNIINGDRRPGRDKVLALCIGAGMSYTETNRALKLAGVNELYPKNERDVRIAIFINNGQRDVLTLNIELEEAGLEILK